MKKIYMDYAATSPVKKEVLETMKPYFSDIFGNASSIHSFGQDARAAVEKARAEVAKFLNCNPSEVIFTSGGTESDNFAIRGIIKAYKHKNIKTIPHIVTTAFEHHAVLNTCQDLEKQGLAEVTYIKPDKNGLISVDQVKKAIKKNTILVSVMYVNNEIGTVQPIKELSAISHQLSVPYFHTDAVQATEYFECDTKKLNVDLMSLSGHKIGGPKGVGILFIKKGVKISPIQTGGAQEFNLRAGTENVAGIVGIARALALVSSKPKTLNSKLIGVRDYFINEIEKNIPDVILNGSKEKRSPNNINFSFKFIEGEAILLNLDLVGIAASSGSACTSGSLEPSHVLLSIGRKHEDAHGSIRFTINEKTTKNDVDYVVKNLKKIILKLRLMSPFGK